MELNAAEGVLAQCLQEGKVAKFESNEERTIRASFLRSRVVSRLTNVSVAPLFIAIENAIIDGDELLLSGIGSAAAPLPPLVLAKCDILGRLDLSDSAWTSVKLDESRIAGLTTSGLRVERSLLLNDVGVSSSQPIAIDMCDMAIGANFEARNLGRRGGLCKLLANQARVGGSVHLSGATLSALDGQPALSMNGIKVNADLLLDWADSHFRFETRGGVRIVNADIGGRASFRGASLDNAGAETLAMDGTQIGGDLLFDEHRLSLDGHARQRFEANGAVQLRGIKVRNSVDLTGARVFGRPDALLLSGAQIGANLILRRSLSNRFEAIGAVGLPRATVGGEIRMQGASLSGNGERFALYMDETAVGGSVFLNSDGEQRFEAKGLIDLYGAKLEMNLVLNGASVGAHLTLGKDGEIVDDSRRDYRPHNDAKHMVKGMALDLRQIAINGKALFRVVAEHRFESRGMVCLNGAKIGSEVLFSGARLHNPKGYTLALESAQIGRDLNLNSSSSHPFESRGSISGWGSVVGGRLNCAGAFLNRREGDALRFDQATIRGEVFLWHSRDHRFQFVAKGAVLFQQARIEGDFKCDGACFLRRSEVALSLADSVVLGGVFLKSVGRHRFEVHGEVRLERAEIGGDLDFTGARLRNLKETAIYAADASIGGDVKLCSSGSRRFKSRGELLFLRVMIKGRLICSGSLLHDEQYPQPYRRVERRHALSLYGGIVHDKVIMESDKESGHRFEAIGFVDLSYARIGAGVLCTATRFINREGTALSLESAKITGDVYLSDVDRGTPTGELEPSEQFEAFGDVDLQAVEISGDLSCDGRFRSERFGPSDKDQGKALIFDNGKVHHRWYVRLTADSVGEASLRGGRVGDLDDDGGNNWGVPPTEVFEDGKWVKKGVKLKLDGFTYERFGPWNSPKEPTDWFEKPLWKLAKTLDIGVRQNIWMTRCEWLQRQYRGEDPKPVDFFPQPHEQAAKALDSMGHNFDARRVLDDCVAHKTRCRADEWLSRRVMKLYSLGFGCGYLPNRALISVGLWWLLGTVAVEIALSQKSNDSAILVKAASSVEIVRSFSKPDAKLESPSFIDGTDLRKEDGTIQYRPHGRVDTRDIACTDADISTLLYALDTMLPVLDLHVEDKCEVSSDRPYSRIFKALYAMIGWIIVALAAFTWTGVFRRMPS